MAHGGRSERGCETQSDSPEYTRRNFFFCPRFPMPSASRHCVRRCPRESGGARFLLTIQRRRWCPLARDWPGTHLEKEVLRRRRRRSFLANVPAPIAFLEDFAVERVKGARATGPGCLGPEVVSPSITVALRPQPTGGSRSYLERLDGTAKAAGAFACLEGWISLKGSPSGSE